MLFFEKTILKNKFYFKEFYTFIKNSIKKIKKTMNTASIQIAKRDYVHEPLRITCHEKKGRCVIANRAFSCGDLIETCPILIIPDEQNSAIEKTILDHYSFNWNNRDSAILLGYGSLYNHSYEPNAVYERDYENKVMRFIAIKDICIGEEITINYNGKPNKTEKIDWFQVCE